MNNGEISKIKISEQGVLTGSARLSVSNEEPFDPLHYVIDNMSHNKAFMIEASRSERPNDILLNEYRDRYREYRRLWRIQPEEYILNSGDGDAALSKKYKPLCVDIETASICDLACSYCYRESIATPDKLINPDLCYKILDQVAELNIPSIKLNWRGEPLMNSRLPEYVEYAKKNGILEVIINTNATRLTSDVSERLIDAGLDLIIYSFDGGTKETYEKMRKGRFEDNKFESVYKNISDFYRVRKDKGAKFPRTKIQMVMTDDCYGEQESFFKLFNHIVDEVTVTQYTERGADIDTLDSNEKRQYEELCDKYTIDNDVPFMKLADGAVAVAVGRSPCEQPFQRLLITYDGRVGMCCYDWGAMYTVGYVDEKGYDDGEEDTKNILRRINSGQKGYSHMLAVRSPKKYNNVEKKVTKISEIWSSDEIESVRKLHACGDIDGVNICANCPSKDTYKWSI